MLVHLEDVGPDDGLDATEGGVGDADAEGDGHAEVEVEAGDLCQGQRRRVHHDRQVQRRQADEAHCNAIHCVITMLQTS